MSIPGQERVGPYRLINLIGKGHACHVWEVERNEERLAMKLLPAGPKHTREEVGYLKREFSVGQGLKHPNVIGMYEFATRREGTYIVLELFRAPNLKKRIQQGVEHIAHHAEAIIHGAAAGLSHLHEKGWIHRDVKPDNFLVDDDANVKLIDFNLAQRRKGALVRLLSRKAKVAQGTRSYMSPEQIRGQTVDERSDLYSLGCVVHEILAGKPPFSGTSENELLNKHLKSKPPLVTVTNPNVTREFAQFVLRTIAKDPGQRPATIAEFLDELNQISVFCQKPQPRTTEA